MSPHTDNHTIMVVTHLLRAQALLYMTIICVGSTSAPILCISYYFVPLFQQFCGLRTRPFRGFRIVIESTYASLHTCFMVINTTGEDRGGSGGGDFEGSGGHRRSMFQFPCRSPCDGSPVYFLSNSPRLCPECKGAFSVLPVGELSKSP